MKTLLQVANEDKLSHHDVEWMNPLKLAYLGDAIFDTYIRTYIVTHFEGNMNDINKRVVQFVKASSQSKIVHHLKDELSEDEWRIIKRGRNQKSISVPKNANVTDYKYATGFEALMGYLYLTDQGDRLYEIVAKAIELIVGETEQENEVK